jgi:putative ABC transport system substrate-binding protein
MQRRDFITLLGGASAAWPLAVLAQQTAMPVIGFLSSGSPEPWAGRLRAFRQGLSETGYIENRNVAIEYRWAEDNYGRLPDLAADLVVRRVAVMAAAPTQSALAAKAATATIPVVFTTGSDPVQLGLVTSLNRPGGNLTGVSDLSVALVPKRLELLRDLMPTATAVALLVNPTNPLAVSATKEAQEAARTLGFQVHVLNASVEQDLNTVFATLRQLQAGGLAIGTDAFFTSHSKQIAALAMHHAIPTIYQYREFVASGGLISYGGSIADSYRLVGIYTGRILNGEKPAELPVQRSTKVELMINLKTAKALGLELPATLLARANEVIE